MFCNTVFRIALYARVNIKAGTELFFNYNYDPSLTKTYKEPTGTVFAVKGVGKPAARVKPKTEKISSQKTPLPSIPGDGTEAQRKALAKARAAKAAKRAALHAESSSQNANSHRIGLQQARKTAANKPYRSRTTRATGGRERFKTVRRSGIVEDPDASESAMDADDDIVPEKVVPETDDEDDEFVPEKDAPEEPEPSESHVSDAEEEDVDMESRSRRRRHPLKLVKSAQSTRPVVAVKKKMSGARPGAGRKRKHGVIINSGDEE